MNQPSPQERARKLADQATAVFRTQRNRVPQQSQERIRQSLAVLRQGRQDIAQLRQALMVVRGELQQILGTSPLVNACLQEFDSALGISGVHGGPGSTLPDAPSQTFPQGSGPGSTYQEPASGRYPHSSGSGRVQTPAALSNGQGPGASTVPYNDTLPLPGHQTDALWNAGPPTTQQFTKQNARPGQTRQDMTNSDAGMPAGAASEDFGFQPMQQSDAPRGLVSSMGESPVPEDAESGEDFGFAALSMIPGATMTLYADSAQVAAQPVDREQLHDAPESYRRLRQIANAIIQKQRGASMEQLSEALGKIGFFDPGRVELRSALLHYLNNKPQYPKQDEWIIEQVHQGIRSLSKINDQLGEADETFTTYFPEKYQQLIRKHQLGYYGWNNAEELARKYQWQLKGKIGAGAMGAVFLAESCKSETRERKAAVKIVIQSGGRDPAIESRLGSKFNLKHQVVPVLDAGRVNDFLFIAMELLEGVSDLAEIPEDLAFNARVVACLGMARSLGNAHREKVLHKDVKPANYLVTGLGNGPTEELLEDMSVYLSDLGLARDLEKDVDRPGVRGTPLFMAPEQARGEPLSTAADVYALGISFYNVLTGDFPYPKDLQSIQQIMGFAARLKHPAVQDTNRILLEKQVPEEFIRLISDMTHYRAEERPVMDEVIESLQNLARGLREDVRSAEMYKMLAKIGIPMVIIIALIIGGVSYSMRRPETHVRFGESRRTLVADIRAALDNENTNPQQLRDLIVRIEQLDRRRPVDYPENGHPGDDFNDPSDDEPGDEELRELQKIITITIILKDIIVFVENRSQRTTEVLNGISSNAVCYYPGRNTQNNSSQAIDVSVIQENDVICLGVYQNYYQDIYRARQLASQLHDSTEKTTQLEAITQIETSLNRSECSETWPLARWHYRAGDADLAGQLLSIIVAKASPSERAEAHRMKRNMRSVIAGQTALRASLESSMPQHPLQEFQRLQQERVRIMNAIKEITGPPSTNGVRNCLGVLEFEYDHELYSQRNWQQMCVNVLAPTPGQARIALERLIGEYANFQRQWSDLLYNVIPVNKNLLLGIGNYSVDDHIEALEIIEVSFQILETRLGSRVNTSFPTQDLVHLLEDPRWFYLYCHHRVLNQLIAQLSGGGRVVKLPLFDLMSNRFGMPRNIQQFFFSALVTFSNTNLANPRILDQDVAFRLMTREMLCFVHFSEISAGTGTMLNDTETSAHTDLIQGQYLGSQAFFDKIYRLVQQSPSTTHRQQVVDAYRLVLNALGNQSRLRAFNELIAQYEDRNR